MTLLRDDPDWSADPFADSLKLQRAAAAVGFDWEHVVDIVEKVREEVDELDVAIRADDRAAVLHELGDLLMALINIARVMDLNPDTVMRSANERFLKRFRAMCVVVERQGRTLSECSLDELNRAWDAAKRADDGN